MGGDRAVPKGCVLSLEPGAAPCHGEWQRCGEDVGQDMGQPLRGQDREWECKQVGVAVVPQSPGQREKPSGQLNQKGIP